MVKYVTFNHQYKGSNPLGLKIAKLNVNISV